MIRLYRSMLARDLERLEIGPIQEAAKAIWECWQRDGQVFTAGNGGSGAIASHFAQDLCKGLQGIAPCKALRTRCLTDAAPVLTAWSNDLGWGWALANAHLCHRRPGDLLVVISGSGASENILRLLENPGPDCRSIAIAGSGGPACHKADIAIPLPGDDMQVWEDLAGIACHAIFRQLKSWAETGGPK